MRDNLKLLTPLLFLKAKSPELIWINWVIPVLLSITLSITFLFLPIHVDIFSTNGFIKSVNSLLAILVGFFIASLTAIAAFPPGNLDKKIAGKEITITRIRSGQLETESLTRRKFLCLLFGYDAFSSLFIYLLGEFAHLLAENIKDITPIHCLVEAKGVFLLFYLFLLSNLFTTMLLGLHYLSERMHRE